MGHVLAIQGLPVPPKHSKPTTPTPSRTVGCALRRGPAEKAPPSGAKFLAGVRPSRGKSKPADTLPHLVAERRLRRKSPARGSGA